MSRCYTFPPPGYVLNESMIESIKGAKEQVKKDRKHKSKDRKRKEREDGSKKHRHHKRRRNEESGNAAGKKKDGCGLMNSEVELLEKSCLTMEIEQQTSSSQNSCDSSIHRPKRVLLQSQPFGGSRHNDSELSKRISKDQKQQSASANEDPRDAPNFGSLREISTKLGKEKKTIPLKDVEKPSSSGHSKLLCSKVPSSTELRFLNLIDNWTPERIDSNLITDSVDEEWWLLLGTKRAHNHQVSNQRISHTSNSIPWPTARFLPEVQLHALPFTVPF